MFNKLGSNISHCLLISKLFTNIFQKLSTLSSNYYAVLGLEPRSSEEKIKNAYYELSKKYHPDKNMGNDSVSKKILEINEAFEVLGNKAEREKYNNMFYPIKPERKYNFTFEQEEYNEPPFAVNSRIYRNKNTYSNWKYEQYLKYSKGMKKRKQRYAAQKYEFHKNSGAKLYSKF